MSDAVPNRDLVTTKQPLAQRVDVEPRACKTTLEPDAQSKVLIDVIHDGNWLPEEFLVDSEGQEITFERLKPDYVRERDWGAGAVAARLAQSLGINSYMNINVARVLMDFARFPGSTPRDADHLHRYAINYPFSHLLSYRQKKRVLEGYYDEVSKVFESALHGRLLKVSIHTMDQYNASGTRRPPMSLMTRSVGYQTDSELPAGLFDPMYPDVLAEFTADRVLHDRISLTLEKAHIRVAHNYPYLLPEGSLEVRHMVWSFFCALREAYEERNPESANDAAYHIMWNMLLDTNLRSSESDSLRSYLHMYRRAPVGREVLFDRAADAYEDVRAFCHSHEDVVDHYRYSPRRSSSIAVEVRKDVACELGPDGMPIRLRHDNINLIADTIAEALETYFRIDRPAREHAAFDGTHPNPWARDASYRNPPPEMPTARTSAPDPLNPSEPGD